MDGDGLLFEAISDVLVVWEVSTLLVSRCYGNYLTVVFLLSVKIRHLPPRNATKSFPTFLYTRTDDPCQLPTQNISVRTITRTFFVTWTSNIPVSDVNVIALDKRALDFNRYGRPHDQ